MGIQEVLTAARSPWQNPFAERLIGSIRRECLNHIVVLEERHLKWILKRYFLYYLDSRTHLSLEKDAPNPRTIQSPALRHIVQIPEVGGLHHRYERRAA
jgi:putative transposase